MDEHEHDDGANEADDLRWGPDDGEVAPMFDVLAVRAALNALRAAMAEKRSDDVIRAAVQTFLGEYRKAIGMPAGPPDWDLLAPVEPYHRSLVAMNDRAGAAAVLYVMTTLIVRRNEAAGLN